MDNTNSRRNSFASPVPAYYLQQNILEISDSALVVCVNKSLVDKLSPASVLH
jgi:hypothetical protein